MACVHRGAEGTRADETARREAVGAAQLHSRAMEPADARDLSSDHLPDDLFIGEIMNGFLKKHDHTKQLVALAHGSRRFQQAARTPMIATATLAKLKRRPRLKFDSAIIERPEEISGCSTHPIKDLTIKIPDWKTYVWPFKPYTFPDVQHVSLYGLAVIMSYIICPNATHVQLYDTLQNVQAHHFERAFPRATNVELSACFICCLTPALALRVQKLEIDTHQASVLCELFARPFPALVECKLSLYSPAMAADEKFAMFAENFPRLKKLTVTGRPVHIVGVLPQLETLDVHEHGTFEENTNSIWTQRASELTLCLETLHPIAAPSARPSPVVRLHVRLRPTMRRATATDSSRCWIDGTNFPRLTTLLWEITSVQPHCVGTFPKLRELSVKTDNDYISLSNVPPVETLMAKYTRSLSPINWLVAPRISRLYLTARTGEFLYVRAYNLACILDGAPNVTRLAVDAVINRCFFRALPNLDIATTTRRQVSRARKAYPRVYAPRIRILGVNAYDSDFDGITDEQFPALEVLVTRSAPHKALQFKSFSKLRMVIYTRPIEPGKMHTYLEIEKANPQVQFLLVPLEEFDGLGYIVHRIELAD